MERFNQFVYKYLIYCSPLLILGVIGTFMKGDEYGFFKGDNPIYHVIGFIIGVWFLLLTYYFFAIAFNENLKDRFVRKLTGIRENDERESQLTGSISKRTFVSMISILILLLFLSTLRIHIYRASETEVPTGRRGTISLGFGLDMIAKAVPSEKEIPGRTEYFKYGGLPLSADGTVLLVLALEMGIFFYFSRREFSREI